MKPSNPTLNALLASGARQFFMVDLFTLTLVDGSITRYCAGDVDIVYGGNTYSAGGQTGLLFGVAGDEFEVEATIGTQAASLTVNVVPRSGALLGIPFTTACRYGVLDGAVIQWHVAVMPTYGDTTAGIVQMFLGRIVEVDIEDQIVVINANDPRELLNQNLPRNLFLPGCMNTLYDSACTLVANSFKTNATVQAGSTITTLLLNASNPTGDFDQGKILFTSGVNSGTSRSVRRWAAGAVGGTAVIYPPLPQAPSAGDTVSAFKGCDKTPTMCSDKFSNLQNFRGFPDIPVAVTAV